MVRFRLIISIGLAFLLLLGWLISQTPVKKRDYLAEIDALIDSKKNGEAHTLLDSVAPFALTAKDWAMFTEYAIRSAKILKSEEKFQAAIEQLDKDLSVLEKAGLPNSEFAAKLWVWKALEYTKCQNWLRSREAYLTAIRMFEKNKSFDPLLTFAYKNVAQNFQRFSDNRQSIRYLEAALRVDTAHDYTASIYNSLANAYLFIDSIQGAMYYYQLGKLEVGNSNSPSAKARHEMIGADLALYKKDYDLAEKLQLEALATFKALKSDPDNVIRSQSFLADLANRKKDNVVAEKYYTDAEMSGKTYYETKNREMAKLYVETGRFYQQQGVWSKALHCFQKALIQVFPDFNDQNPDVNPSVDKAYAESQAIDAAVGKGMVLLQSPQLTLADRQNAAQCFDLAFAIAARLRQGYGDDLDKMHLAAQYRETVRAAALNLVALYKVLNDKVLLDRLFLLFEQFKAQALRDAVQQKQVFNALPSSISDELAGLRSELGIVRSGLLEQQLAGEKQDSSLAKRLAQREFQLSRQYEDRIDSLKNQYQWLGQLLQTELTPDVARTCASLPDTTAILSWFDAGDRYLAIVVRKTGLSLADVQKDTAFTQRLSGFIDLLPDKIRQEQHPDDYFSNAFYLYGKLWPVQALPGVHKVVIIPDGNLCHLPFEALLTADHSGRYSDAPYLLIPYDISYNWSAVWPATQTPAGNRVLFAAPFEQEGRAGMPALEKSGEEKPAGVNLSSLEGSRATAAAFLKQAPHYGVLHLATHAHASGGQAPGIEFYDKTLTIPEISGQRFNAALVSLSACETGTGEFAAGEGVLSLAYAFAYAGAQSLAASQWEVNENSTAQLFNQFYKHLKNGAAKGAALRQSKRDYLKSSVLDTRKAPYYWAAFTLIGADGEVAMQTDFTLLWWAAGAFIALAGLLIIGRNRRKKAAL